MLTLNKLGLNGGYMVKCLLVTKLHLAYLSTRPCILWAERY